jgi:hypothetical protein
MPPTHWDIYGLERLDAVTQYLQGKGVENGDHNLTIDHVDKFGCVGMPVGLYAVAFAEINVKQA